MPGRTAVITGAGQGMGRAIAHQLAGEGIHTILVGRTRSKLEQVAGEIGSGTEVYELDVTDSPGAKNFASELTSKFTQVDMLINCAGEALIKPFEQTSDEDWSRIIDINLKGPFLMARALLPLLRKSENATIVNLVSKAALGGHGGVVAYTAAKAGLLGLTRSLAAELRPEEIRAVAICPGPVDTPMRWAATPDHNRTMVLDAGAIAKLVSYVVNMPCGVAIGEIVLESIHYNL